jgi:hypothetical protein
MTDYPYSPQQALARDVLTLAVNGGITRWARVHGYTVNCPPEQVRAEGIDIADRSLWTVDLGDIERAIAKLIATPDQCAAPRLRHRLRATARRQRGAAHRPRRGPPRARGSQVHTRPAQRANPSDHRRHRLPSCRRRRGHLLMTTTGPRPTHATTVVTVSMTETVTHEITLTPARLADLLDITPAHVAPLLARVDHWGATGPVEDDYALLDEIDCDTYRTGSEDRTWSLRAPGHSSPTPPVDDPHQITDEIRATAADHAERRARALIAQGVDEATAIAQAADEAIEFTRRTLQIARQCRALVELVDAYQGSTYRLLRDLGDHLGASLAYVDRDTVEAHLERTLSDVEWAATNDQFTALDFDEHVGDHGSFRTDWIESLLDKAGVPGYGYDADSADADGEDVDQRSPKGGAAA